MPKVRGVSPSAATPPGGPGELVLDVLGPAGHEDAGRAWTAVERLLPGRSLTVGWDWTATWLGSFGPVVPHRFAIARAGGEPVGAALLTFDSWRRGPLHIRRAHVGTAGEPPGEGVHVERNGLLVLPEYAEAFAGALMEAAHRVRRWDAFALDGFLAQDTAGLLDASDRWIVERETAPVADLTAIDDGGPPAPFSSGVRKEWRRIERLAGPFEVEWAQTPERAIEILDELIVLHQARWEAVGERGAFAHERTRAFHRDLTRRLAGRGEVAVTRVTGAAGLVGCRYDFVDGDRVLAYQSGWAPAQDQRVSTGVAVDLACMGAARARGARWWDHLAGEQRHKRRLSTGAYELVWATRRRGVARWAVYDAARAARRLGRRPDEDAS